MNDSEDICAQSKEIHTSITIQCSLRYIFGKKAKQGFFFDFFAVLKRVRELERVRESARAAYSP